MLINGGIYKEKKSSQYILVLKNQKFLKLCLNIPEVSGIVKKQQLINILENLSEEKIIENIFGTLDTYEKSLNCNLGKINDELLVKIINKAKNADTWKVIDC